MQAQPPSFEMILQVLHFDCCFGQSSRCVRRNQESWARLLVGPKAASRQTDSNVR